MPGDQSIDFASLYAGFDSPIAAFDCGARCAPHNEHGVPFCCDTRHAVPAAYGEEWDYLQANTGMWNPWEASDPRDAARLESELPSGQVLIVCQGHTLCQRSFRSITCRAFPFYPYVTRGGDFVGLSYYWQYEDRCWVASNLHVVTQEYRQQFVETFDRIFQAMPEELENFRHHSAVMRRVFGRKHRAIPLLHRNGFAYKISPKTGALRRVPVESLPKFGPYRIAAGLPFPDELGV